MSSRIQRLDTTGVDCIALVPGPNMVYLTGLHFHLSERPIIAFFPASGQPALLVPALEAIKTEHAPHPIDWQIFAYSDEDGPDAACARACAALNLSGKRLAVERLTMRVLELSMVQRDAPGLQIIAAEPLLADLRMCKDAGELAHMRRAATIAQEALTHTLQAVRPGMTEQEIAAELMVNLLRGGSEAPAFAPAVQSGPNSASPHAGPGSRRLEPGDLLLIDFGATVQGYASDITRTFAIGGLEPELTQVHETVQAANAAGRAAAGPDVPCQEVDRAARRVIEEAGYGPYFIHRTGHGLGLEIHEPPYIIEGNARRLQAGMTFTVEPGIYLPGRGGVRVEDDVVITEEGCESLTSFERGLQIIS
ncbi:MAG: Xaa-Pro peptidase family protein [Anaerolineae bacterium]|jgi:Xaa-Pro dipeptidase